MSRIGRKPVTVPSGVKVDLQGQKVSVQGPKGQLAIDAHPRVKIELKENEVHVSRSTNVKADRALHGLTRSLIQNMVVGVTDGFSKQLVIEGVGFKAQVKGKVVNLALGYTHPIDYEIPQGVEVKCTSPTEITISGMDKRLVGQVAADLRSYHEPEPYKGKGIRYSDETVRRKQGKTVG